MGWFLLSLVLALALRTIHKDRVMWREDSIHWHRASFEMNRQLQRANDRIRETKKGGK